MKTILFSLGLAMCIFNLNAQSPTVNNFFEAVPKSDEIFRVELSGFLFNLAASISDDEDTKILKGIKSVRLLGAENSTLLPGSAINRLSKGLRSEAFEPLAEIRDGKDKIQFLIKENENYISDFVAKIQGDEGGFLLISIEGAFKYEDLKNLDLDIQGMEHLKKVPKETKDYPRA